MSITDELREVIPQIDFATNRDRLRAIADLIDMKHELGRGTCHDEGDPGDFFCSECGVRMFTETNDTYTMIASDERTIIKHPNFCPNCGRRVVAGDAQ